MNSERRSLSSYKSWLVPVLICTAIAFALALGTPAAATETAGTDVIEAETMEEFIDLTAPDLEEAAEQAAADYAADEQNAADPQNGPTDQQQTDPQNGPEDQQDTDVDLSDYVLKRILVDVPLQSFYGAESAVEYEDETVLTFATEADTKSAYEALCAEFGAEHVLLDGLMSLDDDPAAAGEPETGGEAGSGGDPENSGEPGTGGDPNTGGDPENSGEAGTGDDPNTGGDPEPTQPTFHGWGAEYMGMQYMLARYEAGFDQGDPEQAGSDEADPNTSGSDQADPNQSDPEQPDQGDPNAGDPDQPDPVTIAVLDSGIYPEHEIFDGVTISESSRNFVPGSNRKVDPANYIDDYKLTGHGTAVCGIIAESIPKDRIELMVIKLADKNGISSALLMKQGVDYAREHGADVINMSLSGNYHNPERTAIVEETFAEAAGQGVIICASSGNNRQNMDNADVYMFPSESPSVICVGAINKNETLYSGSNYGSRLDFVGPGSQLEVASRAAGDGYYTTQGTSFSCPYIAACAGYLKLDRAEHSMLSARDLMMRIAAEHAKAGQSAATSNAGETGHNEAASTSSSGAAAANEAASTSSSGAAATDPEAATQKPAHHMKFGYGAPAFAENTVLGAAVPYSELTAKTTATSYTYSGKAKTPKLAVTYDGLATRGFDIEYLTDSTAIGTHKAKVTLKGCFTETLSAEASYRIIPAKPSITKVKITKPRSAKKPRKATVIWSKGQKYYQLQLSRKSSFSTKKTWKTTLRKKTVKGLKRGKTYYLRVRTGASVDGEMYWSAWSKTRKIKIK